MKTIDHANPGRHCDGRRLQTAADQPAVNCSPNDVVDMAESLHRALAMPPTQREERAKRLRKTVESHTVTDWLYDQLVDLSTVQRSPARPSDSTTRASQHSTPCGLWTPDQRPASRP